MTPVLNSYMFEAWLFLVWVSSPALLLTWIGFAVHFARCHVFRVGRTLRAILGIALGTIVIPFAGFAVLLVFPSLHVPQHVSLPTSISDDLLPPVFFPSLIAAAIIAPLIAWWVTKGLTTRCSERLAAPMPSL